MKKINKMVTFSARTYLPLVIAILLLNLGLFNTANGQWWNNDRTKLLPEEQAFQVMGLIESTNQQNLLQIEWLVADDYYMYRDSLRVETDNAKLGEPVFEQGVIENDPEFGDVEVYFNFARFQIPLQEVTDSTLSLKVYGQGCNKPVGVCYPPMTREIELDISKHLSRDTSNDINSDIANIATDTQQPTLTKKQSTGSLQNKQAVEKSFLAYLITAFGAGILLSFTPCVLPMIPILAAVITGQQQSSRTRSGMLAVTYVFGTMITYMIAGAIAGATGAQLQAWFQTPLFIGIICAILVLLALSLFGLFQLQLPASLQSRLQATQTNQKPALFSCLLLGMISALVVGACVSPILIVALGTAITKGDPVLGAAIMGSMALGMGLLLIGFGFGAGWLLPKAGNWMQQIQILFGFMVLAVVIYLLSVFPKMPTLAMWGILLLACGLYLWSITSATSNSLKVITQNIIRAFAIALMIWGGLAIVGQALGGKDILRPLAHFNASTVSNDSIPLKSVTTLEAALELLETAKQNQQPALIDFYADWCLDCRRMHRTTFLDTRIHQAVTGWQLIEIDVTENSADSTLVKQHFNVFGPPATLFFVANGEEQANLRQYGYLSVEELLDLLTATQIQAANIQLEQ